MSNLSVVRSFIRESIRDARDLSEADHQNSGRIPYSPLAPAPYLLQYLVQNANAPDICDRIYKTNTDQLLFIYFMGMQGIVRGSILKLVGDSLLVDSISKKISHLMYVKNREFASELEKKQQSIKIYTEIFIEIFLYFIILAYYGESASSGIKYAKDAIRSYANSIKLLEKIIKAVKDVDAMIPGWMRPLLPSGTIYLAYSNEEEISTKIAENLTDSDLLRMSEVHKRLISAPEAAQEEIMNNAAKEISDAGVIKNLKRNLERLAGGAQKYETSILGITLETSWQPPGCLETELKSRATSARPKPSQDLKSSRVLTADERELDTLRQYFKLNYPYLERYITDLASARKFSALGMSKLSSMNKSAQLLGTRYDPSGNPIKTGPEIRNSSTR